MSHQNATSTIAPVARRGSGRKHVTIKTVAEHAEVSPATVSLILSGRPENVCQFHPETVQRVREAAEHLGYHANPFASGLHGGSVPLFALVVGDLKGDDSQSLHERILERELLAGAMDGGLSEKLRPIVATAELEEDNQQARWLGRMIDSGVCGVIAHSPEAPMEKCLRAYLRQGCRVVIMLPRHPSRWTTNAIVADDVATGQLAGRLLAAQGSTRWVVLCHVDCGSEVYSRRRRGLEMAAREVGASVRTLRVPLQIEDGGEQVVEQLRRNHFDAVYAVNPALSVQAYHWLMRAGRMPGVDAALIGTDCHAWDAGLGMRITSVGVDSPQVGKMAVRKLAELSRQRRVEFETVRFEPSVWAGGTCPVNDLSPCQVVG